MKKAGILGRAFLVMVCANCYIPSAMALVFNDVINVVRTGDSIGKYASIKTHRYLHCLYLPYLSNEDLTGGI